jgi:hypothetical protein
MREHLDADACQGTALGELQLGQVVFDEFELDRIPRPESEGQ